jgi:hypothetical protein
LNVAEAFGEVNESIYPHGVAVKHKQQSARVVFRPREQESLALSEIIAIRTLWQAGGFRVYFRVRTASPGWGSN